MSMRAPYILLSSSKAAAARAFHPSLPPSPVRGSSAAAEAAKAREGGRSSLEGGGSEKGKTSRDSGVSRALPLGHEKGYRLARSLGRSASFLLFADRRERGRRDRRAPVRVPA